MGKEFEIRILNVSVEKFRTLLISKGAKNIGKTRMRRYVYHPILERSKTDWLRLRDDGEKITLTFKKEVDSSIGGTFEAETEISNFEEMHEILQLSGVDYTNYQENERELWKLNGCEVSIDFWPKLKPLVEIEGKDEGSVKSVLSLLGYSLENTTTKGIFDIYLDNGINLNKTRKLIL